MPTALITGLRGFTGQYLAAELEAAGYRVVGTVHGETAHRDREYRVDLCDHASVSELVTRIKPDVVAHLAAISFVGHGDAGEIYRTNVVGTRNLLEALAGCSEPPRSVLLASSANVYGTTDVEPIDELVPFQPANDYAVSKVAMEFMARLWYDKLPITVVRPFNYTGVGQSEKFLPAKIAAHFRRGEPEIELGNLDVWRDFSDVRVVASVYRKLLGAAPAGEVFNVCSGMAYSLRDMIEMMESIAGYSINVRVNPAFVRANELKRLRGTNAKLVSQIGPIDEIPLQQTLQWMYDAAPAAV